MKRNLATTLAIYAMLMLSGCQQSNPTPTTTSESYPENQQLSTSNMAVAERIISACNEYLSDAITSRQLLQRVADERINIDDSKATGGLKAAYFYEITGILADWNPDSLPITTLTRFVDTVNGMLAP